MNEPEELHLGYLEREDIKKRLLTLTPDSNWNEEFLYIENHAREKVEIIWATIDVVREGQIDSGFKVVDRYRHDPDPTVDHVLNQELIAGEEVRNIATMRATLPHLLHAIVGQLKPEYYGRVIEVLQQLITDDVLYVREQACVALEALTLNFYAVQNNDGTPFNYTKEDKAKVFAIAFDSLRANKQYPRILEYLVTAVGNLRRINETEAMEMLTTFFYKSEGVLNPDFLIEKATPLAIYFAEFRADIGDGFKSAEFVSFLEGLISKSSPRLEETIVWHFWKTIEDNIDFYLSKFKKYVPLFFQNEYEGERLTQFDFFMEKIMDKYPDDAIDIFEKKIVFIRQNMRKFNDLQKSGLWFYNTETMLGKVAELHPEKYLPTLEILRDIRVQGNIYIGDVNRLLSIAKGVSQDGIEEKVETIKNQFMSAGERLDF